MASPDERIIQETTDALFGVVNDVLNLSGVEQRFVVHAMLVYEIIDMNGDPYTDYVVSNSLTATNTMGLGMMVYERALRDLLGGE